MARTEGAESVLAAVTTQLVSTVRRAFLDSSGPLRYVTRALHESSHNEVYAT